MIKQREIEWLSDRYEQDERYDKDERAPMKVHSLMKSTLKRFLALILVFVFIAGASGVSPQTAQAASESNSQNTVIGASSHDVILLLAPFLTWDDLSAQQTPHLWAAATEGEVANINARARAKFSTGPSFDERSLTLGAGAPMLVDSGALAAYQRSEKVNGDEVAASASAYLGAPMAENQIAYLGLPRTLKVNAKNSFDAVPGLLGETIKAAGGVTAAIGNSDISNDPSTSGTQRPAALVAMDKQGYVRYGNVSEKLLTRDPGAPLGERADSVQMLEAMQATKEQIDAAGSPQSLVVIDPGDLYRAYRGANDVLPQVADQQWATALKGLDQCYAQARSVWPQATIIVSSVATRDRTLNRDSFGPLIISLGSSTTGTNAGSEAGVSRGILQSSSTHRKGLVTDLDISASILLMLGMKVPVEMVGSPLQAQPDTRASATMAQKQSALQSRITTLNRMNKTATSVEAVRIPAINAFVAITVCIVLLGAALATLANRFFSPRVTRICKRVMYVLILFALSLPVANWLMFFIYRWPATPAAVLALFLSTAGVLTIASLVLARWESKRLPLILLIAITVAVIIVDQFLGAPASFASLFGYSPIAAARYYGMGNEAAAILVGGVMIGCGLLIDQYNDRRWMPYFKRYGVAILGLLTMVSAAAPMLGANAGVAIWATVGFILLWFMVNARKFSWKTVLFMLGTVVAIVVIFILADLFLPGVETHLGRLVTDTMQGGFIQLWIMVARKVATNVRVFAYTTWAYILVAVIAFLVYMSLRPTGDFAVMLKENPGVRQALLSVFVTGLVAFCTEDSGIVLPALMVFYLGASIVWLMLGPLKGLPKEERIALRRDQLRRKLAALEPDTGSGLPSGAARPEEHETTGDEGARC